MLPIQHRGVMVAHPPRLVGSHLHLGAGLPLFLLPKAGQTFNGKVGGEFIYREMLSWGFLKKEINKTIIIIIDSKKMKK